MMRDKHVLELLVIRPSACRVDEPARYTRNQKGVLDLHLDNVVQFLLSGAEHVVELLCLRDGTWEAVEDESGGERKQTKKGR